MRPRFSARKFCFIIAVWAGIILLTLFYRKPLSGIKKHNVVSSKNESRMSSQNNLKTGGEAWYFPGGSVYPTPAKGKPSLFPYEDDGDRIIEQLMYVPEDYQGENSTEKIILTYNGLDVWDQKEGSAVFDSCPVSRCKLTGHNDRLTEVDAILYKDQFTPPDVTTPFHQIWILYLLECPYHTPSVKVKNVVNWTATYRRDSDLVAPYERWTYFDNEIRQKRQSRDYAANKTKKVAWFVSNCKARNNRLSYARELNKHIQVDIYGACGSLDCPRFDERCFEKLDSDYKFYLAFENSNCKDYITEKFYINALAHNVLPIVMGAKPEDYKKVAPERSYIHVDDFASPTELAAYLHRLDKDDNLYNSYFRWKGTGAFINTHFWCRLCAMLHAPLTYKHYEDIDEWWRGPGICTPETWRNLNITQ